MWAIVRAIETEMSAGDKTDEERGREEGEAPGKWGDVRDRIWKIFPGFCGKDFDLKCFFFQESDMLLLSLADPVPETSFEQPFLPFN